MKYLILFTIAALMIVSCKQKIPYTQGLKEKYNITDPELKKLQFYLMQDIVLYAGSSEGGSKLEGGEIIVSEEKNIDKVIFRAGTPCVLERIIGSDKIAISFEAGKELIFGTSPNSKRYLLQAQEWKPNGRGVIEYGGKTYLTSRSSANAYLSIKLKKTSDLNNSQRTAKGRKL